MNLNNRIKFAIVAIAIIVLGVCIFFVLQKIGIIDISKPHAGEAGIESIEDASAVDQQNADMQAALSMGLDLIKEKKDALSSKESDLKSMKDMLLILDEKGSRDRVAQYNDLISKTSKEIDDLKKEIKNYEKDLKNLKNSISKNDAEKSKETTEA